MFLIFVKKRATFMGVGRKERQYEIAIVIGRSSVELAL